MRVVERCGRLNFVKKPIKSNSRSQLRMQDFDSHGTIVLDVFGEKNRSHSATAHFAIENIPIIKSRSEAVELIEHASAPPEGLERRSRSTP